MKKILSCIMGMAIIGCMNLNVSALTIKEDSVSTIEEQKAINEAINIKYGIEDVPLELPEEDDERSTYFSPNRIDLKDFDIDGDYRIDIEDFPYEIKYDSNSGWYYCVDEDGKITVSFPISKDGQIMIGQGGDAVSSTIGDSKSTSITEFTVGESTYPRGDINLDGNVNTVDLLMLKKYLLGLMEW